MRVRLTKLADRDIAAALAESRRMFGDNQAIRYASIIENGIALLLLDPNRPASRSRSDIGAGIRSMHLQFAARRTGGASHFFYYRIDSHDGQVEELVILRVLGDRMEPSRRVASALRSEQK